MRPRRARSPTAAMAIPGEAIQAFWLALTTRSMPQASISNGMAPRPLMPSTTSSGSPGAARTTPARAWSGLATPVDVSLWVMRTARYGSAPASRSRRTSGSAAVPHSKSRTSTAAPKADAMWANRSPNEPMLTASTRSPGDRVLTMAASMAPDPEPVSRKTSPLAPISSRMPDEISWSISANSGPRWLIICADCASRTDGGRGVGPGVRRFCSMRRIIVGGGGQPSDMSSSSYSRTVAALPLSS
jgi:hypothetical protein